MEIFLPIALLLSAFLALLLGYPVAFTLAGVAFVFALIGVVAGTFDVTYLSSLPLRFWGSLTNDILVAVPLFVFMGVLLERSRVAESLLSTMAEAFGSLRGGLGYSTILVGVLLSASTGIMGATVVTMGLISLPAMLKAGYDRPLATGLICASGSLAQIIPPSTVLVFLAVILQSSYSQAQMSLGNFAPETLSVGDLFAGAFIPGILLAFLYLSWVALVAFFQPSKAPGLFVPEDQREGLWQRIVVSLLPAVLLIFAVLGSIIAGVATPTEAASVGALGAMILASIRMISDHFETRLGKVVVTKFVFRFWIVFGSFLIIAGLTLGAIGVLNLALFAFLFGVGTTLFVRSSRESFLSAIRETSRSTLLITSMIFVLFLGASIFSLVFSRLGGEDLVLNFLASMPGGLVGATIFVLFVVFLLGCFLDPFEIIFIVMPIAGAALLKMGADPVWLAIMVGIMLQTSYLTPPFGFALFFLKGVAPPEVRTIEIYRGIVPFVVIQLMVVCLVFLLPELATWLPDQIYQ
jgi:TRAP-type mannitol/chloroaromatic compound transport system permease large subunit